MNFSHSIVQGRLYIACNTIIDATCASVKPEGCQDNQEDAWPRQTLKQLILQVSGGNVEVVHMSPHFTALSLISGNSPHSTLGLHTLGPLLRRGWGKGALYSTCYREKRAWDTGASRRHDNSVWRLLIGPPHSTLPWAL